MICPHNKYIFVQFKWISKHLDKDEIVLVHKIRKWCDKRVNQFYNIYFLN